LHPSTLELVAEALDSALACLESIKAKSLCRDERGQFAACGTAGGYRRHHGRWRRQDRRRSPKHADHAGWLAHWSRERRDTAREVKRERRTLGREQRKERRQLNRDAHKDARRLEARHSREVAGSRNLERTAERHREERAELATTIRADRAAQRDEHVQQRAEQRRDHRDRVHDTLANIRAEHAEIRRGHREERQDERETGGKSWKAGSNQGKTAHPCRDDQGQFALCGAGGRARKWGKRNSAEWRKERQKRFNARLVRRFPFLRGKPIGRLFDEHVRGTTPREQLTRDQADQILAKRPIRAIRRLETHTAEGPVITSVETNPFHGILAEEKRFHVDTIYRGRSDNTEAFNDRKKAYAYADRIQRYYVRDIESDARRRGKSWKAETPTPRVPSHKAILAHALDSLGLTDAYHAGELDGRQHLDVLHAVRLEGRRWLRTEAERLLEDVALAGEKALFGSVREKVGAFFGKAKRYVRELFAAGVLAVAGPDPSVLDDPVVQTAMAEQVDEQMGYMEAFQDRIVSEARPLAPAFVANAEQYGSAVYGGAIQVQRIQVIAAGKHKEERRVLGDEVEHCRHCPPLADLGWQPIGTLPALGYTWDGEPSDCRVHCACHFIYR
jgi:hypothetical protein